MKYYLTRACELEKHDRLCRAKGEPATGEGWLPIMKFLAGGDSDVFNALWSFANFSHALDDALDESGWGEDMIEAGMTHLHDVVASYLLNQDTQPAMKRFLETWHSLIESGKTHRSLDDVCLMNRAMSDFFMGLHLNPFIQRHRPELLTMFVQAMTRNLDGDMFSRSNDPSKRALAPVLRCSDVDVLMHIVYLNKGWGALRTVSPFRSYDEEDAPEGVQAT